MSDVVETLSKVCRKIGAEIPRWTQGAGGNVSVKENGILWIKASGKRLDEVADDLTIAQVALDRIREFLALSTPTEELYSQTLIQNSIGARLGVRPSMETGFHACLDADWILHFHSLASLLICHERTHSPAGFVDHWLQDHWQGSIAVVPPILPGLELSLLLRSFHSTELILLENHGVVLQGKSPELLLDRWQKLEEEFCHQWNYPAFLEDHLPAKPAPLKIYFPDSAVFASRIRKVIRPYENTEFFYLNEDNAKIDRDAAELWTASSALYASCPTLAEFPKELAQKVSGLPTELERLRVKDRPK